MLDGGRWSKRLCYCGADLTGTRLVICMDCAGRQMAGEHIKTIMAHLPAADGWWRVPASMAADLLASGVCGRHHIEDRPLPAAAAESKTAAVEHWATPAPIAAGKERRPGRKTKPAVGGLF